MSSSHSQMLEKVTVNWHEQLLFTDVSKKGDGMMSSSYLQMWAKRVTGWREVGEMRVEDDFGKRWEKG